MNEKEKLLEKTNILRAKLDDLVLNDASPEEVLKASVELDECFAEYYKLYPQEGKKPE